MNSAHVMKERAETTIQTVVLVPVVFLVAFMCFHIGSLLHQRHIAQVAAIRGATAASSMTQSADSSSQAIREITRVVTDLDSQLASAPRISYRNKGVQVTVSVKASTAVSFLPSTITAEVWRPIESFRLEQDRQ